MKHSLAKNAGYNLIYQFLNVLFPLISAGYAARILAPEGVGTVTDAQNTVSYFVMFAALGIPGYGTREIARHRNEETERSRVFSELLVINALATTVCLAAYLWLGRYLIPEDPGLRMAVGLELLFCYGNIDWFYLGLEEYGYITARNILVKAVSLAALFLVVKEPSDYAAYAVIHCLGAGFNNCCNVIHARKYGMRKVSHLNLMRHMPPVLWLLLGSVTASLYSKVDITMLGTLADPASVAFYANSHKVIGLILGLVTAVTAVFLPRLSFLYAADRKGFENCLSDGLHVLLLLAVPACAGMWIVAEDLLLCFFGSSFLPGAQVLRILAVLILVKGVGDLLCYQTILSSGNERYLLRSRLAAGIANVILNAVLIPRYAHCGAAAASVVSELMVNGILLPRAWKIAGFPVPAKFCGSILVSTAVMAMGVLWLREILGNGVISLLLTVISGMVLYGAMLLITNGSGLRRLWDRSRNP